MHREYLHEQIGYSVARALWNVKKKERKHKLPLSGETELILILLLCSEALTAVYRTISTGLERNLGFFAAAIADYGVHLTGSIAVLGSALGGTAFGAAAGLVLEAFFCKESLLRSRKNKFTATVTTSQGFILVHG